MWTARFDPEVGAILTVVKVFGPNGHRDANFLLDTGAWRTSIDVDLTDELGYGAHMGNRHTRTVGAGAPIHGYSMNLQRIEIMGTLLEGFEVVCDGFDPEVEIDGLIGMDFLRDRVLTIDAIEGRVTLLP